jgi:glycosyltransferase involved in cell wall biosynthesis
MGMKVVVFSPHCPVPPLGGSHLRTVSMLTALVELGCDVTLYGSTILSNTQWRTRAADDFFRRLGVRVVLHRLFPFDFAAGRLLKRLYRPVWSQQVLTPILPSPPLMRRRFADLLQSRRPDVAWMNYACWHNSLPDPCLEPCLRIVDTHDLITANMQMQRLLEEPIKAARLAGACDARTPFLQESFFEGWNIQPLPSEFEIYDRYHCTIAISVKEGQIIAGATKKTTVKVIPMSFDPVHIINYYDDIPIMVLGSHLFNLQGGLFFAHRVLPRLLERAPSFRCRITGRVGRDQLMPRSQALIPEGFVPDLTPYYRHARFALCPVFGGTGQQVKIVEAMAHGLAVVALRAAAESSPIRHGINGFLASDAAEFAEYTLALWDDVEACRRMGRCARETIASGYLRSHLLADVWQVLHIPRLGPPSGAASF